MTSGPASPLAKVTTALPGCSPLRPEGCEHLAHPRRKCPRRPAPLPARLSRPPVPARLVKPPARVRDTLTVSSSCSPAGPHRLAGRPVPPQPRLVAGRVGPGRPAGQAHALKPADPGPARLLATTAPAPRARTLTRSPPLAHSLARTSSTRSSLGTHTRRRTHCRRERETRK